MRRLLVALVSVIVAPLRLVVLVLELVVFVVVRRRTFAVVNDT